MRVLVCGGRNYADESAVFTALDHVCGLAAFGAMTVIQGGATGADELARRWCALRCMPYINVPADWTRLGRAAGPIRNQRMIDQHAPDLALAFPGGSGTVDMVSRARKAGIEVREVG